MKLNVHCELEYIFVCVKRHLLFCRTYFFLERTGILGWIDNFDYTFQKHLLPDISNFCFFFFKLSGFSPSEHYFNLSNICLYFYLSFFLKWRNSKFNQECNETTKLPISFEDGVERADLLFIYFLGLFTCTQIYTLFTQLKWFRLLWHRISLHTFLSFFISFFHFATMQRTREFHYCIKFMLFHGAVANSECRRRKM